MFVGTDHASATVVSPGVALVIVGELGVVVPMLSPLPPPLPPADTWRVIVFEVIWLALVELSVATAVMLCIPDVNVRIMKVPLPISAEPSRHSMLAIPFGS